MVTVPSSPARLNSGPANVYLPTGIARTGAEETGQGLLRAGALLAQVAERQQAWEEKQQQARDAVEAIKAQTAATRTLNDAAYAIEREGDWRTGVQRFDQAAQGLAQLGANIKDPVARARLDAHVQGLTESRRASLRNSLFKLEADDAVASLDESLETLSQAAANAPNRAERERHQAAAANAIKSMADAGYIDRRTAVNLHQKFKGKISAVEAERVMNADPVLAERLLADPKNFPDLDPERREKMLGRAYTRIDLEERRRVAREEKAEREAEKRFNDAQRFNEGQITAFILEGKTVTPQMLADAARAQKISGAQARTLADLAKSGDDVADDMRVVLDLQTRLYQNGEDISSDVLSAATSRTISRATAYRLQKESVDRQKQNPLSASQKADLDWTRKYLGADKLAFSFDDDTAQRVALAEREFQDRVIGKKEDSREVANDLVARYAKRIEPIPGSILGEIKTPEDVDAAGERLRQLRDSGIISQETYRAEAARLKDAAENMPPPAPSKARSKKKAEVEK